MRLRARSLAAVCLITALPAVAEKAVLVEIDGLEPGDLEVRGFELDREQEVRVEAAGLDSRRHDKKAFRLAVAWILDSKSREVVWNLEDAQPADRRSGLQEYDEVVQLGAGSYEAYYATYPSHRSSDQDGWWESAARSMARMFGWDDDEDYEEAVGDLRLVIRGDGRAIDEQDVAGSQSRLREDALVAVEATDDDHDQTHGFILRQPMELLVYAVGELTEGEGHDYGWIIDATTRKKVWTFTWGGSEQAGGAKKNRVAYDTLSLPAGKYAAHFVTDGSHSPERWNALPPRDPAFWGLTLWPKDPQQLSQVEDYEYRHLPGDDQVVAELTRLRDDDHRTQGFTLSEPLEVRIYAVGEGRDHGMNDYGWIVDARTRRRVWTMDYERSEHAGGSSKNRVIDEMIRLDPGSYIVRFVTDGSHAYRDWNAGPPTYPERWGITLFGGEGFDRSVVSEYRKEQDPGVLARIARVTSHSRERIEFTLDRNAEVSLYALGEGIHGEMHDYAWLEDSDGRVVWKMTYQMTEGAGGASKNRLYQGTLDLSSGDYVLHYQSDDSHAFRDWNASPPDDPEAWGVQIALLD